MRIIAGTARGRVLKVPQRGNVRPTADRVRETIFNVLGQWLEGERVLDLFAGSGSLGLEALSRGAQSVVFVEQDRETLAVLAENARTLGFAPACTMLLKPADRALRRFAAENERFSLVFADPPYGMRAVSKLAEEIAAVVAPGGRAVLEHDRREEVPRRAGDLVRTDERRFGDTLVTFYAHAPEPPQPDRLESPGGTP